MLICWFGEIDGFCKIGYNLETPHHTAIPLTSLEFSFTHIIIDLSVTLQQIKYRWLLAITAAAMIVTFVLKG